MDPVSRALSEEVPLPISLLANLGKGSLRLALLGATNDQDVSRILGLWPKLVLTASSPRVNDKHITAASNALCVYLACGLSSAVTELQHYVSSQEVWFEAFQCAHKAFNDGKTKPAFQIMETLCELLQEPTDSIHHEDILKKATLPLVRTILLASPHSEVKKSCLMLSCIHKRIPLYNLLDQMISQCLQDNDYLWRHRLTEHNISISDVWAVGKGSITRLFLALIIAMVDLETRSAALKLCSVLSSSAAQKPGVYELHRVVERVIHLYLKRNKSAVRGYAENVLPVILDNKTKLLSFVQPYATSCCDDLHRMALFLAILKVSRAKAILSESETFDTLNAAFPSPVKDQPGQYYWCNLLLMTGDSEVQILLYGLLVSSPAGNAIVSPEVLDCIALAMKYLHNHADAHERSEILGISKRLLKRLHNGALANGKSVKCGDDDPGHSIVLTSYESFARSLYDFLKNELSTGVSYPRHILALNSLQHFFDSALNLGLFLENRALVRALINLVLDPFEDVRSNAAAILNTIARRDRDLVAGVLSPASLKRVEAMAVQTGRADHADALGRLLCLHDVCRSSLSKALPVIKDDMLVEDIIRLEQLTSENGGIQLRPGCNVPIHGALLGISYRLQPLHTQHEQLLDLAPIILNICVNVWNQVKVQLCIDSPETAADIDDEINEGPKDLLAFSWRALRDSSVLLQSLIAAVDASHDVFQPIGDLCMDQLISLRHRGAFSTVAHTFNQCCEKIRSSAGESVRGLIRDWYRVALTQIEAQADRLTRRSAGLPAMMSALLSPADSTLFSTAVSDLMVVAQRSVDHASPHEEGQMKLAQVHALNCLKDIMTNSRFADAIIKYQNSVMELASSCLSSKIWAIRNCGLMLLRACINRLDTSGTAQTLHPHSQSREDEKADTPTTIAFRLLDEARSLSDDDSRGTPNATEHVFAGLDLLGHLNLEGPKAVMAEELVLQQLANPTWAIRDRAALLLATSMSRGNPITSMLTLLEEGLDGPENSIHGTLLCCRYLMEQASTVMTEAELESLVNTLIRKLTYPNGGLICHSPYVYSAWLDLLNDAAALSLDRDWIFFILEAHSLVDRLKFFADSSCRHGRYFLQRIFLLETYCILKQDHYWLTGSKEMTTLTSELIDNIDALSFTLDNLKQRDLPNSHQALLVFLAGLIDEGYVQGLLPAYILEQAFTCMKQSFDHLAEAPVSTALLLLDWIDFGRLNTPRELRNAGLELQASLLGIIHAARSQPNDYQGQVEQWLSVVEESGADDLDFPTRLSAAVAISTYTGYLTVSQLFDHPPRTRLRFLRLIYDLLNDDDEDVRAEAILATRRLKIRNVDALENLDYCAFAAREVVLLELKRQFSGTLELTETALLNVLRLGHLASDLSPKADLVSLLSASVKSKLRSIAKTKNDLFAEERQNLYIDDIREIKAWTGLLEDSGYPSLGPELLGTVEKWTTEGLDQVIVVLENDQRNNLGHESSSDSGNRGLLNLQAIDQHSLPGSLFGHPLGASYDHEILVVLVQVISLAGVLYRHQQTAGEGQIRNQLEKVKDVCSRQPVNFLLMGVVEHVLDTA